MVHMHTLFIYKTELLPNFDLIIDKLVNKSLLYSKEYKNSSFDDFPISCHIDRENQGI